MFYEAEHTLLRQLAIGHTGSEGLRAYRDEFVHL